MEFKGSYNGNNGFFLDHEVAVGSTIETEIYQSDPPAGDETFTLFVSTGPIQFEVYRQVRTVTRGVGTRLNTTESITNIGAFFGPLGRFDLAVDLYERLLKGVQKQLSFFSSSPGNEVEIKRNLLEQRDLLNALGLANHSISRYDKAIDYYQQALEIARLEKDKKSEASILSNIGAVYASLSRNDKAIDLYQQALSIQDALKDEVGAANTLNNLGVAFDGLHRHTDAIQQYKTALAIFNGKSKGGEAETLINLGGSYRSLCQQAITAEARGKSAGKGFGKSDGTPQSLCGKAIDYHTQALTIAREIGNRSDEGFALNNLGIEFSLLNNHQKAVEYFKQALLIYREVDNRAAQGVALNNLMFSLAALNQQRLAIFYGKQAINIYQTLRGEIKSFEKETQKSFLSSRVDTYRELSALLISEGRLPEAQQVLDLLKEEEYARLITKRTGNSSSVVPYSSTESIALKTIDSLATLGSERAELLAQAEKRTITETGRQRLNQIEQEIEQANKELRLSLDALGKTDADTKSRTEEIKQARSLQSDLKELGPGAVALYTVVSKDAGWIILIGPDFRKAYPVDVTELEQTVFDFRETLRSPTRDPRALAQKLYQKLFLQTSPQQKTTLAADLETYLSKYHDKTLMWSLDGVLRYIPVAALSPDGVHYLVERYRNIVFTTASLPRLKDRMSNRWEALGLGVSMEKDGFPPLEGVERELRAIISEKRADGTASTGILPGTIKLNDKFSEQAMLDSLREGYAVVHIASHFQFQPAQEEKSFLLLGDGHHLSMEDLRDKEDIFAKVDLLTLSACDTATASAANGKEMEGLGYVAQSLGAKSVIASLWPVADASTDELMQRFYKLRQDRTGMSKAEALQLAQLALLRGEVKSADAGEANRSTQVVNTDGKSTSSQPLFKRGAKAPYAHPFYWAPFVLIGNWR
ncbi:MAG: CHAT domain-containing protein [Acidobacteriota bacterium]|nr:CHAT domain-containing protein [Acidobacteriota bacterium]